MSSTGVSRIENVDPSVAIKAPCRLATTANITLSGLQTIDSVAGAADDRILVRCQDDPKENGIYPMSSSGWQRATDFDGNRDFVKGTLVSVTNGATYAGATFKVTSENPITINTSDIEFATANAVDVTTVVGTSGTDTYAKLKALTSSFFSAGDIIPITGDGIFGKVKVLSGAISAVITGITRANPAVVTATGHPFSNNHRVYISGVSGMTQVNGKWYTVAGAGANTFQLQNVDSSAYTAYSSGGTATRENDGTIFAFDDTTTKYLERQFDGPVLTQWWEGRTNAAVRAAINTLIPTLHGGGVVQMEYGGEYDFTDDGLNVVIPSNVTVDGNMSEITYSGSAIAFTLGTGTGITYQARLKNVLLKLTDKDSDAVFLNECVSALVSDCYLEGCTSPIDNTRTNVAITVDGGDESSYFNHFENIDANHMHKFALVTTSGSLDPTQQHFVNCKTLGDQATDTTSIGYHFVGNSFAGQGSTISGGNIELCNTCVLLGAGAGQVIVDGVRIETNVTGTAWKFDLTNNSGPIIIRNVQGLGTTYMESNSGIRNWDAHPGNTMYGSDASELRLGGFDKPLNGRHFIGMRDAVSGSNAPQIWFANNSDANILIDSDNTGTGRVVVAAGRGSSDTGGGFIAHSHAHASNPGCMDAFYSAGASGAGFRVTTGIGGTVRFFVDASSTRPGVDSSASLGDGTYRWTEVHADNATINTSDERYKTDIEPLIDFNDAILDAWQAVDYMKYKKLDAVEKKGDGARWHFGVIAQRVVKAFEERGIDPFTLGPVCYDKWDEIIETHLENVLDEDGNAIPKLVEMRDESGNVQLDHNGQPRMIEHGFVTREVHTVIPAGDRYGIRYEECFALESALNRREIKRLKKLILGLANQVNK